MTATARDAIYAILAADTGVGSLCGDRIYPLRLPQTPTLPAVTYFTVSAVRERAFVGNPGIVTRRVQVSSWSKPREKEGGKVADAVNVAEAVRAALERYTGTSAGVTIDDVFLDNELDIFDPDSDSYQIVQDYTVHHRES